MTPYYGKNGQSKAERDLRAQLASERRISPPPIPLSQLERELAELYEQECLSGDEPVGEYDEPEELTEEEVAVLLDIEEHSEPLHDASNWQQLKRMMRGEK